MTLDSTQRWEAVSAKHYADTLHGIAASLRGLAAEVEHRGLPGPEGHVESAAAVLNRIASGIGNLSLGALARAAAEADAARRSSP